MSTRPPSLLRWVLVHSLPEGLVRDGLVGDLDELYGERRRRGRFAADAWYAAQVLTAALHYLLLRGRGPRGHPGRVSPWLAWTVWVGDAVRDLRFALHGLKRRPLLAVVTVVTVSLGVGATTVVTSVANALLVRPFSAADPAALFVVNEQRSGQTSQVIGVEGVPYTRFIGYRDALGDVFTGMGAERLGSYAVAGEEGPFATTGYSVSGSYFQVLGLVPTAGRFFTADDEASVVIGYDLWRSRFGGDPTVVGRTVHVDSRPYTVAGVAPAGFHGTMQGLDAELWLPIGTDPTAGWVTFFGRLRPGVDPGAAGAEVDAVARRIPPLQPQTRVRGARLETLTGIPEVVRPLVERFLGMLLAMAVLVLLIAGANIAGVLLARGAGRRREMAVRVSLGASRGRVLRQLLAESLLLFLLGGALGAALAVAATRLIQRVQPPVGFRIALDLHPDPAVLAAALVAACGAGLLFGMAPAHQASRGDPVRGLKDGGAGGGPPGRGRSLFVGSQVALSLLLLVTAGLLVRSLQRAATLDLGFDAEGVVIGTLDLAPHGYDEAKGRELQHSIIERLGAVPGVTAVALSANVPLFPSAGRGTSDARPEDEEPGGPRRANVPFGAASVGYFKALRVPMVAGRGFTAGDGYGARAVTVVNRTLAERFWPDRPAVGQELHMFGQAFEVVGVTGPGKYGYINEPPTPWAWFPLEQRYGSTFTVQVRSRLRPAEALVRMRQVVAELDSNLALRGMMPLSAAVDLTLFPQQFAAVLVGLFGLVGALLACVGVYGILANDVARRTHEMGVRLALGARPERLRRAVLGRGLRVTGVALLVGLALSVLATRLVASLMIGVSRLDPLVYVAGTLLLGGVAMLASWVPAGRATRIDPCEAIRTE